MRGQGDNLMKRNASIILALLLCVCGISSAQTSLSHLRSWTGKYPTQRQGKVTTRFFQLPQIRQPLSRLLSRKDFNLLTRQYEVETPIKEIGDFLVVKVCRAHNCSEEQAGFAINLISGTIYVRMYANDETRWFGSKGQYTDAPQEVREYLDDFSAN
jgi:hypothetical protein